MLTGIRLLQQHPQPVLHVLGAAQKGTHSGPRLSLKDARLCEPVALRELEVSKLPGQGAPMPLPGTQDRAQTAAPFPGAGRLTLRQQQPLREPVISTNSTRCDLQQKPLKMCRSWRLGTGKLQGLTGSLPVVPPPGQKVILPPLAAGPGCSHWGRWPVIPGQGGGPASCALHPRPAPCALHLRQVCGWQRGWTVSPSSSAALLSFVLSAVQGHLHPKGHWGLQKNPEKQVRVTGGQPESQEQDSETRTFQLNLPIL